MFESFRSIAVGSLVEDCSTRTFYVITGYVTLEGSLDPAYSYVNPATPDLEWVRPAVEVQSAKYRVVEPPPFVVRQWVHGLWCVSARQPDGRFVAVDTCLGLYAAQRLAVTKCVEWARAR